MRLDRRNLITFVVLALVGAITTALVVRATRSPSETQQRVERASLLGGPAVPQDIREPLVNTASYEERARILDQKWSSWPAFGSARDHGTVRSFCSTLVASAQGDRATEQQRQAIEQFMTDLLHGSATNEPGSHLRRLAATGEVFNEERLAAGRKYLSEKLGVPPSELNDPVEVFLRCQRADGFEPYLDQLVLGVEGEGSRIEFQLISTPPTRGTGDQLMDLTGHVQVYHPVSTPPRSLQQALQEEGEVLTAVVHVFVRKPEDMSGATQPLIMRLWYDAKYKAWRRSEVLTYPMRKDRETGSDLWTPLV